MNNRLKKSICLVGLDCYPILSKSSGDDYIGGESVQISLLALAFSKLGLDVSVICGDYGQPEIEYINGIRVIKAFKTGSGIPFIRFLYRRIYRFMRALQLADSDIYFQSCSGFITGLVALHSQLPKKRKIFIFRVASDADCIPDEHISTNFWQRCLYNYGLKRADTVSVQSIQQKNLLKKNYDIFSTPVNMISEDSHNEKLDKKDIDILWVGNIRKVKRPEIVYELAKSLPEYKFVVIGGPLPGEEQYYSEVEQLLSELNNIDFKGFIPYSEVNQYFCSSKLLLNTSEIEGFPNTFLQAWARKTPVVSFFDPDDLIANEDLGSSPKNTEEMISILRNLLSNDEKRIYIAEKCKAFSRDNYAPLVVAKAYLQLINK